MNMPKKCSRSSSARSTRQTDSMISSDSDIRFTRRKLGDSQRCGCAVIAGFLIFTLFATVVGYIGCKCIPFEQIKIKIYSVCKSKFNDIY